MSEEEIALIERYLKNDFSMLEYGSGGSTLRFSPLVKKYYSIESDKEWADKVMQENPPNVNLLLAQPKASEDVIQVCEREMKLREDYSWDTLFETSFYKIFDQYVNGHKYFDTSDKPSNAQFDAVLIDGRARQHCAKSIYNIIDENAVVFVHDFFPRLDVHYGPILEKYKIIDEERTRQTIVALKKI